MLRLGLAVLAVFLLSASASACSVPVFRFALENWDPSAYELVVYHRGPLSAQERGAIARIAATGRRANVRIADVDLAGDVTVDQRRVWELDGKDASLPRLILRYPECGPEVPGVWSGSLSGEPPPALLDSPARRRIFASLTSGHAAALVLLLSGDDAADAAARSTLARELPRIAARIELPSPTRDGPQVKSELPLRVDFPVIEVARKPEEDLLVRMLLGSEDGLAQVRGPIVFPVFGRGRALCSLHGSDLTKPGELQRTIEWLCKACSCQAKELNPGLDLLITGDWDIVFATQRGPRPREVEPGATGAPYAESRPANVGPPPAESRSPPPPGYAAAEFELGKTTDRPRPPWLRFGTVAAAALVLATGFWLFRSRRAPPPTES